MVLSRHPSVIAGDLDFSKLMHGSDGLGGALTDSATWDQSRIPRDDSINLKYKSSQIIPFKMYIALHVAFFFFCAIWPYITIGYQK